MAKIAAFVRFAPLSCRIVPRSPYFHLARQSTVRSVTNTCDSHQMGVCISYERENGSMSRMVYWLQPRWGEDLFKRVEHRPAQTGS
jgi:hypothetical protein